MNQQSVATKTQLNQLFIQITKCINIVHEQDTKYTTRKNSGKTQFLKKSQDKKGKIERIIKITEKPLFFV